MKATGTAPRPDGADNGSPTRQLLALFDGHRLSPTQRRIAQYILDHMPEAALLSSVDLAARAGVSQPSVTRFAVAVGFAGYPGLRAALRPIALGYSPNSPEVVRRNKVQAGVDTEIRNLQALRDSLADPTVIDTLGQQFAASQPLVVLGLRISAPLARYFSYAAARIHPDVRCLTEGGSSVLDALSHAHASGATWVCGFAMPRYAAEFVTALRYARRLGMHTAVVTDVPLVPFAADVDVLLPAGASSQFVFDSYAAPMVLAAALLQSLADARPEQTQQRLETYERMVEEFGPFIRG